MSAETVVNRHLNRLVATSYDDNIGIFQVLPLLFRCISPSKLDITVTNEQSLVDLGPEFLRLSSYSSERVDNTSLRKIEAFVKGKVLLGMSCCYVGEVYFDLVPVYHFDRISCSQDSCSVTQPVELVLVHSRGVRYFGNAEAGADMPAATLLESRMAETKGTIGTVATSIQLVTSGYDWHAEACFVGFILLSLLS